MANATYILGTGEYVVVEIERTRGTYTPADWTYEMCLLPLGEVFAEATAGWVPAIYELAGDKHTVKTHLTALTNAVGRYQPRVRLTSVTDAESPVPLRAIGMVIVGL